MFAGADLRQAPVGFFVEGAVAEARSVADGLNKLVLRGWRRNSGQRDKKAMTHKRRANRAAAIVAALSMLAQPALT